MSKAQVTLDLVVAFNLGLASQVHCIAMCGGIVAALTSVTTPGARSAARTWRYAAGYNLGRIASYTLAGVLLGGVGAGALAALDRAWGHALLRTVAAVVLVVNGLALMGLLPRTALFEGVGLHVWRRLQPLARRLLPVTNVGRAFFVGMVWGWLPCALVYSTLVFALSSAAPLRAGAIMAAFGSGTLPALMASFWLGDRAQTWFHGRGLRLLAGAVLIGAGLVYPFMDTLLPGLHTHHPQLH